MAEPNHINGLVKLLRDNATVSALVGSRVYGVDGVPESENDKMPRKAIVVSPSVGLGTIGTGYQRYSDRRVDVACFGESLNESHKLFLEVRGVLKQLRRQTVSFSATEKVLLHWATVSNDGVPGIDPDTEWPMTLSAWMVLVSEVPVAS